MNKIHIAILVIACSLGIQAKADTIAITYNFAGAPTGPPVMSGATLILDGLATGSILSGNSSLDTLWNPVTYSDNSVIDLTTGLLNGTFSMAFADGSTLSGNLFEDVSQIVATGGVGPFTQMFTFTGGTGEFVGATGSISGTGVGGADGGFTTSGRGTVNAPAIPEPASAPLLLGGLAAIVGALRRSANRRSQPGL
jgi:PEP-CTERM motif